MLGVVREGVELVEHLVHATSLVGGVGHAGVEHAEEALAGEARHAGIDIVGHAEGHVVGLGMSGKGVGIEQALQELMDGVIGCPDAAKLGILFNQSLVLLIHLMMR